MGIEVHRDGGVKRPLSPKLAHRVYEEIKFHHLALATPEPMSRRLSASQAVNRRALDAVSSLDVLGAETGLHVCLCRAHQSSPGFGSQW